VQEPGQTVRTRSAMRFLGALSLLLISVAVAGCGGSGDEKSSSQPASTQPSPRERAAATAVFERAYSECSTYTLKRLALKYHVGANFNEISAAVARDWAKRYHGTDYAVRTGREACLQALRKRGGGPAS
jgi:hypothetical protein